MNEEKAKLIKTYILLGLTFILLNVFVFLDSIITKGKIESFNILWNPIYCLLNIYSLDRPIMAFGSNITILFVLFLIARDLDFFGKKKFKQVDYDSHGSARWQNKNEIIENYTEDSHGWYLGSLEKETYTENTRSPLYKRIDEKRNSQIIVIGPPNANKTTGFIMPNIIHLSKLKKKPDQIIIDPKSEILTATAKELEKNNYEIKVLDLINLEYGNKFNPLHHIYEELDVLKISKGIVKSCKSVEDSKVSNNDFWTNAEFNLLGAVIGYIIKTKPKEEWTLEKVQEFLTSDIMKNYELAKETFNGITGAYRVMWNTFLSFATAPETYSNILGSLLTTLSIFSFDKVKNLLSSDDIEFEKIGLSINCKNKKEEMKKIQSNIDVIEKQIADITDSSTKLISNTTSKILDSINTHFKENKLKIEIKNGSESEIFENINKIKTKIKSTDNLEVVEKIEQLLKDSIQQIKEKEKNAKEELLKEREKLKNEISCLKDKNIALFILIKDEDKYLSPITNLAVNTIIRTLYENARKYNDRLPTEVMMLLEEFNNIGKIDEIEQRLGTMRGRRIYPMMIIQSIAQLKDIYQKSWENIMSQCDNLVVLGCNDITTGKEITSRIGKTTIQVQNTSKKEKTFDIEIYNNKNLNESYQGRDLITIDELMRFDLEKLILFQRGSFPATFFKTQYEFWNKEIPSLNQIVKKIEEKEGEKNEK